MHTEIFKRRHGQHERQGSVETVGIASLLVLLVAVGGGLWWYLGSDDDSEEASVSVHEVGRGEFLLTITERGDIESAGDVEVRCEVKSKGGQGTAILRIVPEGTKVKEGDFLVELDSSALEEERTNQQILVNTSEAAMVESQNIYETAQIAKKEYLEGTFVQEKQTIESEIFVAEENLSRAKEYLNFSVILAAKGHITEQQLEADRFAVDKAQKELEAAQTKLQVLERFTRAKQIKTLESDIVTAKAKWESAKNTYDLDLSKYKEIEDQIAKCTINAPIDGTVVYAHERDWRGDGDGVIEEGKVLRERQAIIRLPDPTTMRVELTINESLVKYVKAGQAASIEPIGLDKGLAGTVTLVNQYSEPDNWRRPDIREYKAFVQIDETHPNLRSGMTSSVTIECEYIPDALQVPLQAVYGHGKEFFCFVRQGNDWEARKVTRGPTNDKFFVIQDGLQEGEQVALAPRELLDQVELPKLATEESQQVVRAPGRPGSGQQSGKSGKPQIAQGKPAAPDKSQDGESETAQPPAEESTQLAQQDQKNQDKKSPSSAGTNKPGVEAGQ